MHPRIYFAGGDRTSLNSPLYDNSELRVEIGGEPTAWPRQIGGKWYSKDYTYDLGLAGTLPLPFAELKKFGARSPGMIYMPFLYSAVLQDITSNETMLTTV